MGYNELLYVYNSNLTVRVNYVCQYKNLGAGFAPQLTKELSESLNRLPCQGELDLGDFVLNR